MYCNRLFQLVIFAVFAITAFSSEFDLIDNEIVLDYNHEIPIHKYNSEEFDIMINILTKDKFIAGSVIKNTNPKSSGVNHFEIYGVEDEPEQVYFNGEPLYYLNWIYDHEKQMINIVNIDHDITEDFIIEWKDETD